MVGHALRLRPRQNVFRQPDRAWCRPDQNRGLHADAVRRRRIAPGVQVMTTRVATAGTTYEVRPDRIRPGFHVAINSCYGKPETISGFPTIEAAKAFIEAERAKHRPGR